MHGGEGPCQQCCMDLCAVPCLQLIDSIELGHESMGGIAHELCGGVPWAGDLSVQCRPPRWLPTLDALSTHAPLAGLLLFLVAGQHHSGLDTRHVFAHPHKHKLMSHGLLVLEHTHWLCLHEQVVCCPKQLVQSSCEVGAAQHKPLMFART